MALLKSIQLPSGYTAEYVRLEAFRWDRISREVSATFYVYKDQAAAGAGTAASSSVLKLRLRGQAYTQRVSPAALATAGNDIIAVLYVAAKQASGMTDAQRTAAGVELITDFGSEVLATATDV